MAALELLKGLLCTPNELGTVKEYREVYAFGREMNVDYVLMNPLSNFGRGESNQRLRSADATMTGIERVVRVEAEVASGPEPVFTRFPNTGKALGRCVAGEIFYVFANGDATVCPYLVFASRTEGSKHDPAEFVFANLFDDPTFATRLDEFDFHKRYKVASSSCETCSIDAACGKGCPAAVISSGNRIGEAVDALCPRPALPVALPIPRRRSQTAAIA